MDRAESARLERKAEDLPKMNFVSGWMATSQAAADQPVTSILRK
jgi:hypothetical protein